MSAGRKPEKRESSKAKYHNWQLRVIQDQESHQSFCFRVITALRAGRAGSRNTEPNWRTVSDRLRQREKEENKDRIEYFVYAKDKSLTRLIRFAGITHFFRGGGCGRVQGILGLFDEQQCEQAKSNLSQRAREIVKKANRSDKE